MMVSRASLALGMALVLVSSVAMAQTAKQKETQAFAKACAGDIKRLCPGVPPGEGRIKACMKAHADKLSRPCFDAILGAAASR
jgi:cysteine rich repeat protein